MAATVDLKIVNTTKADLKTILWLFQQAIDLQGKNGYKVWSAIDSSALENEIEYGTQYKIVQDKQITAIFSVQLNDPFIWQERDQQDAIYLHRIVVHPNFKGQRQFEKVLNWARHFAQEKNLKFIRMDTWAENAQLIDYYKSFGFKCIDFYKTTDSPALPLQNRNLNVALLEMTVEDF